MNEIKERYINDIKKEINDIKNSIENKEKLLESSINDSMMNDNKYQNLLHYLEDTNEKNENCQKICRNLIKYRIHKRKCNHQISTLKKRIINNVEELNILKDSLEFYTNYIYIKRPETVKGVVSKKEYENKK